MTQLLASLPFLLGGLIAVTLIDTAGAYASRRFNFNYGYLTIASFIVYAFIGLLASKEISFSMAILINLIIGFYDATIGWKLSRKLNANTGLSDDELKSVTVSKNLTVMLAMAFLFTYIGYLLGR